MLDLGRFALLLGLFLGGYAVIVDLLGAWRKDYGFIKSARNATGMCFLCLSVAITALCILLIRSDFTVEYVAEHTSRALPFQYKISALWAGASGSLLLWLWIQVGFVALVYRARESEHRIFTAGARAIANLVNVFFFIILIADSSPFKLSAVVPPDGAGLNPLLQHPAMVLHPPILFIGYAGFLVPFAWAFGWLKVNSQDALPPLFKTAGQWALLAWLFLTAGIVLGAWWAYEELGWGGYWAWDPVENASLMPWLTATALLHCFRTYKQRSSTATWTMVLSSVTFSLCVFGRFLTKYGSQLFESVHTFGEPGLGILYLVLLILLWAIAAVLMIRNHLRNKKDPSQPAAKANKFVVFNNWLMVLLTIVICVGTLFPFLSKIFIKVAGLVFPKAHLPTGAISWTPQSFTKVTAPGGLLILLFISLCPYLLAHGLKKSWRSILAGLAAVAAIVAWLRTCSLEAPFPDDISAAVGWIVRWLASGSPAIPCFIFSGLLLVNVIADFVRYEVRIASGRKAGSAPARSLRWYGARFAHFSVALIFIGIAGSAGYDSEVRVALRPGEKASIGRYELTFDRLSAEHGPNFTSAIAHISVYDGREFIAELRPARAYHKVRGSNVVSEVDVRRTLAGDLYLVLEDVDQTRDLINLRIAIKPLINWIWIGSFVMIVGALAVLIASYRRKTVMSQDHGKDTQ